MKPSQTSNRNSWNAGWQVLGETELASGERAAPAAEAWLADTLSPLNLHAEFLAILLMSAQEALARANRPAPAAKPEAQVHLRLLVPAGCSFEAGQTWGFFRIWKSDDSIAGQHSPDQVITLYLYPDGQ